MTWRVGQDECDAPQPKGGVSHVPLWLRDAAGTAHVVALSGGADSSAMALRLQSVAGVPLNFACTPTGDELPAMFAHWKLLANLLGQRIVPIPTHSLGGLIEHYGALPNLWMRWCTRRIKIEPYLKLLVELAPAVSYVGLRADEQERTGLEASVEGVEVRYPLREWGWERADVEGYLAARGVVVPTRTDCARCFYQTIGEWWLLWKDHPEIFASAEAQERATGHTFRSNGRDSWPAGLEQLRQRFESGEAPRKVNQLSLLEGDAMRRATCRVCTL